MAVQAQVGAIIDGEHVDATRTFTDIDPSTGAGLAEVAAGDREEVDRAVAAARRAFETTWRRTTVDERASRLRRLAQLIRGEAEQLALTESRDTGKPLTQARTDVENAAKYFDYYGDTVKALFGDVIPAPTPGTMVLALREPYGVTAHIVPWNYPIQISARTVAPALATGNCCVLKPAEEAPLTAIRLGDLALEAGFPKGVLNVVPGLGEEAGAALAAHSGIDHLSFTGSPEVGTLVSKAAAENHVPVTLELGGKSPNLLLADADLDTALPVIVNSIIQNGGQTCSAGSRLLVEASIQDRVTEELRERFGKITIGPGPDDPQLGPLISRKQLERVKGYVELARSEGRVAIGGAAPDLGGGYFFQPTILDQVSPEARVAREEIFGPVLTILPFTDAASAIRIANGTDYGLVAAVWTRDLDKALWLANETRAGQVFVNTYGAGGGIELPFGGYKHSGHGREKGFEALAGYTHTKTVVFKYAEPR
jgi:aldehyde dehydrogenase (NAD+)